MQDLALISDRLLLAGLDRRCASVRSSGMSVLDLEQRPDEAVEAMPSRPSSRTPSRSSGAGRRLARSPAVRIITSVEL